MASGSWNGDLGGGWGRWSPERLCSFGRLSSLWVLPWKSGPLNRQGGTLSPPRPRTQGPTRDDGFPAPGRPTDFSGPEPEASA